jgi:hypothetical protein
MHVLYNADIAVVATPSELFMPLDMPVILKLIFAASHDSLQRLSPTTACKTLHSYRSMLPWVYHTSTMDQDEC